VWQATGTVDPTRASMQASHAAGAESRAAHLLYRPPASSAHLLYRHHRPLFCTRSMHTTWRALSGGRSKLKESITHCASASAAACCWWGAWECRGGCGAGDAVRCRAAWQRRGRGAGVEVMCSGRPRRPSTASRISRPKAGDAGNRKCCIQAGSPAEAGSQRQACLGGKVRQARCPMQASNAEQARLACLLVCSSTRLRAAGKRPLRTWTTGRYGQVPTSARQGLLRPATCARRWRGRLFATSSGARKGQLNKLCLSC